MLDLLVGISWREALAIIVALLVLYVAFVFFRLRRLKQRQRISAQEKNIPNSAYDAVGAYLAVGAQGCDSAAESAGAGFQAMEAQGHGYSPYASDAMAGDQYGLVINDLEREVAQLRKEVGSLRAEVLVLREEVYQNPPDSVDPPIADEVSPYYSDAMQLALQGLDPDSISRQCAISRAEAELVLALVRNRVHQ